jgi:Ca-activated chloride channel family protein
VSFDAPLLLLTLLVVPAVVAVYLLAERRRMRYAMRFTNLDVLAAVAGGRAWRRYVPLALFLLALATLLTGMARPQVEREIPVERATVILVVDVSRSMEARDVRPTRLAAAQAAVRTFLDRAPKELRVGLVVFAGEPQIGAPPTTDRELVRESVDQLGQFPGFGTAIGDALALAVELGQQAFGGGGITIANRTAAPAPSSGRGLVSILFLSDGQQTRGNLFPLDGAERARIAGFPVYTIALGTPNGTVPDFRGFNERIPVPPDPETLRAIAQTTGGRFFEARTAEALDSAYADLGSSLGRNPGETEVTFAFLAGGAGLLLAAGLLSALWSPRLP